MNEMEVLFLTFLMFLSYVDFLNKGKNLKNIKHAFSKVKSAWKVEIKKCFPLC